MPARAFSATASSSGGRVQGSRYLIRYAAHIGLSTWNLGEGRSIAYSRQGTGSRRLAFLHGLCGTREVWSKQIPFFTSHYEVLSFDLLGHGKSSPIPGKQLIGLNVSTLKAFLLAHPKPTTCIGCSFGGLIANDLIDALGVENIVFVDSPCLVSPDDLKVYTDYERTVLEQPNPAEFVREWFSHFVTEKASLAERELVIGKAGRHDPRWVSAVMGGITAPVKHAAPADSLFVMEGAQYYSKDKSTSWLRLYPDAKSWMYPGRGHFFFLEDAPPFNQALADFLRSRE